MNLELALDQLVLGDLLHVQLLLLEELELLLLGQVQVVLEELMVLDLEEELIVLEGQVWDRLGMLAERRDQVVRID